MVSAPKKERCSIFLAPVGRYAKELGLRVSLARRKRRQTQAQMAMRAEVSLSTYQRIERGDPDVALYAWLKVLFCLDGLRSAADVLRSARDEIGLEVMEARLPQRIRRRKADQEGF
ncbi:MAG: helix-turn-helix transcriptional regulator [Duodenibacillus sp.]|nr:helix-turn-helix transcriptional regulator [Duodenibacillus sp.]